MRPAGTFGHSPRSYFFPFFSPSVPTSFLSFVLRHGGTGGFDSYNLLARARARSFGTGRIKGQAYILNAVRKRSRIQIRRSFVIRRLFVSEFALYGLRYFSRHRHVQIFCYSIFVAVHATHNHIISIRRDRRNAIFREFHSARRSIIIPVIPSVAANITNVLLLSYVHTHAHREIPL